MAVDVFGLDYHVAETNSHAQVDTAAMRHPSIAHHHGLLHVQSATHGVNSAAEFDERAIARVFDDPTTIFSNFRLYDLSPAIQQTHVGTLLIAVHQTRIAHNIHDKDRRQPTFK